MKPFDAAVVGGGPGGYVAAIRLAQLGKRPVLIEERSLGGVCLAAGCIPSKALIALAHSLFRIPILGRMGLAVPDGARADLARMVAWKDGILSRLQRGIEGLLKANGVTVIRGRGRLESAGRIAVKGPDGESVVEAGDLILATGSRPISLPFLPIDQKTILDSTGALALSEAPPRLAVIGGGYIGLELGTAFAHFGSRVTVVELTGGLLPGTDPELTQVTERHLKKTGVEIRLSTKVEALERAAPPTLRLSRGGATETLEAEAVLVTVGRRPNSEDLGLESAGVEKTAQGYVPVDGRMRTNLPRVYAIGDLTGPPMLAHRASWQGEIAAEAIAGGEVEAEAPAVPAVIFTEPEIAYVGLQEPEARAQGRDVLVGRFPFRALGRSAVTEAVEGLVKIIADRETHRILGIAVAGAEASNLIGEAVLALRLKARLEDLAGAIHPHPTLTEALMEAAKAALGRPIHFLSGPKKAEDR